MKRESLSVRFARKYRADLSGCWLWTGAKNACGYGSIGDGNERTMLAHRASWLLSRGDPGMSQVLHRCDVPACVNPEHLFLGTHTDNMRDMAKKGRSASGPTPAAVESYAKITRADADLIRLAAETLPVSQSAIGKAWGIKQPQVSRIISGRCWA